MGYTKNDNRGGVAWRASSIARLIVIVSALTTLGTGCSSEADGAIEAGETGERVGRTAAPIVHGTESPDAQDATVLLILRNGSQLVGACTGTMVAPNLVLTARHCVSRTDDGAICNSKGRAISGGKVAGDHAPGDISIYRGRNAILLVEDDEAATAHGKELIVEEGQTICNSDVAFVLLDRSINGPIAAIRLEGGAREGEELTGVGWGLTEQGQLPRERMQRSGIPVLAAGPTILDKKSDIGLGDAEFLVGESICQGDSGGPAFSSKGAIVGVVSRGGGGEGDPNNGASGCTGRGVLNIYTHLGEKGVLLARAFVSAGTQSLREGDPPGVGVGEACKKDADCMSDVCASKRCAARCDDGVGCASDQLCRASGPKPYCIAKAVPISADAGDLDASPSSSDSGCRAAPSSHGGDFAASGLGLFAAALLLSRRRAKRSRTL